MQKEKLLKKVIWKLKESLDTNQKKKEKSFEVIPDLTFLLKKKKDPKFLFHTYIMETYGAREAQYLVWLLDLVNKENTVIIPGANWIVKEIRDIKKDDFIKLHVDPPIIKKYNLLP